MKQFQKGLAGRVYCEVYNKNLLKKAGIENVAQLLEKMAQGDEALLAIQGFAQSSLTSVKKKLRVLGYELPETAA